MMWGNGWAGWVGGLLMMALFWGGLLAAIYVVARTVAGGSGTPRGGSKALQVLAERFARGEISAEEFEEGRNLIEGHMKQPQSRA